MVGFEVYMQVKDRQLLARLMAVQKVSGRKLAEVAGYKSHTYLQRLLRGEDNGIEIEPANRIAAYLHVTPDVLFVTKVSTTDGENVPVKGRAA